MIEIFKTNENKEDMLAATFHDDNKCCPFVHVLFQEAIYDPLHVFTYSGGELEKQKNLTVYKMIPQEVEMCINTIINYVENLENYSGVKVYI